MAGEIEDAVPPHEPAEETLIFAGRAALSLIPGVGGIASEALAHALAVRDSERRHAFDVKLSRALDNVLHRLRDQLTLSDVVGSDEFLAAVNRARRIAEETSSDAKRARLAEAAAHAGPWSGFARSERALFLRLTENFDDLHVWLLHYFADPHGWLASRDLLGTYEHRNYNSVHVPLAVALGNPSETDWDVVISATDELSRQGLLLGTIGGAVTEEGTTLRRLTERGERFLTFVAEQMNQHPSPPTI